MPKHRCCARSSSLMGLTDVSGQSIGTAWHRSHEAISGGRLVPGVPVSVEWGSGWDGLRLVAVLGGEARLSVPSPAETRAAHPRWMGPGSCGPLPDVTPSEAAPRIAGDSWVVPGRWAHGSDPTGAGEQRAGRTATCSRSWHVNAVRARLNQRHTPSRMRHRVGPSAGRVRRAGTWRGGHGVLSCAAEQRGMILHLHSAADIHSSQCMHRDTRERARCTDSILYLGTI